MIDILCTVLWVPYRVVHTIRRSQLHESFLLTLLEIALKSMSVRVVLDFLNQFSNAGAMQLFHGRMWYAWNVEVNVLLVDCTIETRCSC